MAAEAGGKRVELSRVAYSKVGEIESDEELPNNPPIQDQSPKLRWLSLLTVSVLFLGGIAAVVIVLLGGATGPSLSNEFARVNFTASEFAAHCEAQLSIVKRKRVELLSEGKSPAFDVLATINQQEIVLGNIMGLAGLLGEVHPDPQVRLAATKCEEDGSAISTDMSLDPQLYSVVAAVNTSELAGDRLALRLLNRELRDFRESGVNLPNATRARLKQLEAEMTQLSNAFSRALKEDVRTVTRSAQDAAALAGLPADFVARHTTTSSSSGDAATVTLSTDYPDYFPVMKYAVSPELRREMYTAFKDRGAPGNIPRLQQLLQKRAEFARLVCGCSWAEYSTRNKMIGGARPTADFITAVAAMARNRSNQEMGWLHRQKRDISPDGSPVQAYDVSFLWARLSAASLPVDPSAARLYFTFPAVRDGVMANAARMFRLRFSRVQPGEEAAAGAAVGGVAWHPDVEVYDVMPEHGASRLGRVYLDMFPRPGKYKHAAQFPVRRGVAAGGEWQQLPEGALVCNFPPSGPMEHSQVVTFFHEFGHLMHHILGGQRRRFHRFSGVATEWDFVEAPSQMMEEWAWHLPTLRTFAAHAGTGAPLPASLAAAMRNASLLSRGSGVMQQLFYAALSLQLHDTAAFPPPPGSPPETLQGGEVNSDAVLKRLQAQLSPFPWLSGTHFQANFGHLVGYSSNYYTYMWSLVISKDLLSEFLAAPGGLRDRGVAARYQQHILGPGGTRDASSLVTSFLDRPYTFRAFRGYLAALPTIDNN